MGIGELYSAFRAGKAAKQAGKSAEELLM